ncbi:MAG: serine/threonine-protein kinase [Bryobacteraceae bacterium]
MDSELGNSVLGLLSQFDRLAGFLEEGAFGSHSESQQEPRPGDVLCDRFRIIDRLGSGGMGEVYRAEDLILTDIIALKTIRAAWRNDLAILARFRDEIRLARRIGHRNVCKIFDFFTDGQPPKEGIVFFTMEYLDGETLRDRLSERGRLTERETLHLAEQIAAGLNAAHSAEIIHRDLKPANILLALNPDGTERPVITDFGLAKPFAAVSGHPAQTQGGQIIGSPDYMAPEQFETAAITPAVDIFAFGVILFELISGVRPYPSEDFMRAAIRRVTQPAAPLRQLAPDAPANWERVLAKALDRNPQNRYRSAVELIRDLNGPARTPWRRCRACPGDPSRKSP